ncbi:MAG: SRPBCC family protein [Actinomycetota bacterium]|nr:SRPBCC family protein [Actinomycetota bacterium]MDQ6945547.1 SRPBCC family protein [Actinomycetota bacterium]
MESRRLAITLTAGAVVVAAATQGRARWLRWGATTDELRDALPGDDLIVDAHLVATRAITIDCGPEAVWPWIAQLGQGRGGWYSYDFLENIVGCDIHSADRIVAAWQDVRVDDEVHLAPQAALLVAVVKPPRALVLRGSVPVGNTAPFDFSWAFAVRDGAHGTTRLVVRERYRYQRWWAALLVEPTEIISFVMSQKMLRSIRDRAERSVPGLEAPASTRPRRRSGRQTLPRRPPAPTRDRNSCQPTANPGQMPAGLDL